MPRVNKLLLVLLGLALVFMVIVTIYDIFFKPQEEVPTVNVVQIEQYLGEDVLEHITSSE